MSWCRMWVRNVQEIHHKDKISHRLLQRFKIVCVVRM